MDSKTKFYMSNRTRKYGAIVSLFFSVSFYQNSSVWLDRLDAWSRDRNPSNCTLDLVSDCSIDTAIWMHYLDANKMAGEKARRQLHKNAVSNIEQVLEATPHKTQLYGHLPPIMKTIQVRQTRHSGHCWRSRDELISDVLLWTPTYGRAKTGWLARTYIQQLCEDTGCIPEDLPEAI